MAASDWDAYWRNARSAAAHKDGGPQDEVLERFWLGLFEQILPTFPAQPTVLDIACGNGAVVRFALKALHQIGNDIDRTIVGLDESPAALEEMHSRHPAVYTIAAHGSLLPFQDAVFNVVTSQFGLEYAGAGAIAEAARVVGSGGILAAVMHQRDGAIYQECAANLDAIDGFRRSNLLPCFEELFRAAQAVQQGRGARELFQVADQQFAVAVAAAEAVLRRRGKGVADGMLFRLYTEIGHMYRRFRNYEPDEVFTWIDRMAMELDTFSGRMASMLDAALGQQELDQVLVQLTQQNFSIRLHDTLNMGVSLVPAAWVFVAQKATSS